MNLPTINGHCTSDRVLASSDALLFNKDGRTYAVLNIAVWKSEGMVLLVVDDKVYHDWAGYMVHNYERPGSEEFYSGEGARRSVGVEGSPDRI